MKSGFGRQPLRLQNIDYACFLDSNHQLRDVPEETMVRLDHCNLPIRYGGGTSPRTGTAYSVLNSKASGMEPEEFISGLGAKYYVANVVMNAILPATQMYKITKGEYHEGIIEPFSGFSLRTPIDFYVKLDSENVDDVLRLGAWALKNNVELKSNIVSDETIENTLKNIGTYAILDFDIEDKHNLDRILRAKIGHPSIDFSTHGNYLGTLTLDTRQAGNKLISSIYIEHELLS